MTPRTQSTRNRPAAGSKADEAWTILLDLWLELRTSIELPFATREEAAHHVHHAMLLLAANIDETVDLHDAMAEVSRLLASAPDTRAYVIGTAARESLRALVHGAEVAC